ncbi:probable aspartic proteinase GIP2 [Malania oleifera]|uniref:probable aspartic proteinase GIP2 n=1 Tax=Malania oleifera TaxID=397392 RepID=UPI0025AE25C4|nr:probable aspartic proteinase GIP2 [Malania oleifera]
MASPPPTTTHIFFLTLFLLTFPSHQTPSWPKAFVLPLSKHAPSLQYTTLIHQGTPPVPVHLVLNLNAQLPWVGCGANYNSSSYQSLHCLSPQCSLAEFSDTGYCTKQHSCFNDTCILLLKNAFNGKLSKGELGQDVLRLPSTDGFHPGPPVSVPRFLFSCAPDPEFLHGLASGAKGLVGLGHGHNGLPSQLSSAFNLTRKFAVCLPPSADTDGVLFFGDGPYVLLPNIDVSKLLIYTPLIVKSPLSCSYEYAIRVKSIMINGKKTRTVLLNSSLLSVDQIGRGRTKISTIDPYTVLETSIYNSFTKLYVEEAMAGADVTRVAPVAPFEVCFSAKTANGSVVRPGMPVIDLVFQSKKVFWRIFETNSMVAVREGVSCLAFLDGGLNPSASIVIGGYQLQDNFIQFDLESLRFGFTSSLLSRQTSCANFDFSTGV